MVGATCRKRAVILGLTIAVMTITGIVLQDHAGRHRAAIASYQLTAETHTNHPADPATAQPARLPGVFGVAFSPSGKFLASGYGDGTVRLWNLGNGQIYGSVLRGGSGRQASVFGVAFSPDGRLLASADADGTVQLWDLATGRLRRSMLQRGSARTGGANAVAFSPDGKLLASADADGTARLWDPATGRLAGSPLPAGGSVFGVAFGSDGKLAIADVDGSVLVWNTAGGRVVGPDNSGWFIAVASAIALALSVAAIAVIAREIRLARGAGQRS